MPVRRCCETELFGDDMEKIKPIINPDGSDTAMFDNTLEFLYLSGRSLPHAAMMMVPEPWSNHEGMDDEKKAFYEYHSCLMEPWDGPAAMAFTDGTQIGAILDRNGLRPARYYVTKDDVIVLGSEAGTVSILSQRTFCTKTVFVRAVCCLSIPKKAASFPMKKSKRKSLTEHPYREWLDEHLVGLEDLPDAPELPEPDHETVQQRQQAFGYTFEDLRKVLEPMAGSGVEPIASMGYDAPLAVLVGASAASV